MGRGRQTSVLFPRDLQPSLLLATHTMLTQNTLLIIRKYTVWNMLWNCNCLTYTDSVPQVAVQTSAFLEISLNLPNSIIRHSDPMRAFL